MIAWVALITTYVVLQNLGYAAILSWLLNRCTLRSLLLIPLIWAWAVVMSVMFVAEIFGSPGLKVFMREWLYFPMAVEMVWNVLILQGVLALAIIVTLAIRISQRLRPKPPIRASEAPGISRRRFLYLASAGAAPVLATGMGLHGALTRTDLRVREFNIPITGLPPELEGFSIAHVSDLHSGLFVGPDRLRLIRETANGLKADLLAVTGDIINRSMDEFGPAMEALHGIQSRYGAYACEGNHDTIPGDGILAEACGREGLPMLSHGVTTILVGGKRIHLAGLPWMGTTFEGQPELVSQLFPQRQEGDVRILLAHHPHVLDIADSADLVLAGHTHGGQIMLGDVGLGRIRFKYCSGLYQRGNTKMLVSNGCGDWFPCRIGAPAEVGLVRLIRAV